ncbi:glycerol-3-phosphate dehydrogenase (NAD(P)+) [Oceanicola granulosus HTCC2516]|uniref:Glycerol-3-phosphate dehydrogenase [NAD(P)+] n=1 Tax=Oceanicola granulosus (strain ATCC BAA-861 / DSM 15982 / KCTC 12143 / HTCC2516) TaxID=314256 RepID=Q2CJM3_OCEGH|nr:NAD(P)H-dependent glycerol-3-phosphate dehydrogenase [Oceanicola granulosus]EAR53116.1 glycerol-3-phosphate dehydrogenase (NAD(P)+) [Oceanicola granulosus HTCC2516]
MIAVAGGGAFGTALAAALAANGPVTLWMRDAEEAARNEQTRENRHRLAGVPIPAPVRVSADLETVFAAEIVLLAIPAQQLRPFLAQHGARLAGKPLVACSKGIDVETGEGPSAIIEAAVPDATAAVLTGPSFAADIARSLPTALTLACRNSAAAVALQDRLSTPVLRLYRTADVTGAELGGALKNVMAIACGTCIGAGFGESARAALITRGFAEMQRLAVGMGAEAETLAGLSGFGDLTLTCTSDQSRNYRHGLAIGRGERGDTGSTVEGVATARAIGRIARVRGLDLPVCAVVEALVEETITAQDALARLLSRPLKEE